MDATRTLGHLTEPIHNAVAHGLDHPLVAGAVLLAVLAAAALAVWRLTRD